MPAIGGITPIHHRDSLSGIHLSGLPVQSICLLHLHKALRDEKPYAAHISSSRHIDDASHFSSLPSRTSLRNIRIAVMVRFRQEHIAQLKLLALETTLRPVTFDQARRARRVGTLFVVAVDVDMHIDPIESRNNGY
jgi:hypothetical protein